MLLCRFQIVFNTYIPILLMVGSNQLTMKRSRENEKKIEAKQRIYDKRQTVYRYQYTRFQRKQHTHTHTSTNQEN